MLVDQQRDSRDLGLFRFPACHYSSAGLLMPSPPPRAHAPSIHHRHEFLPDVVDRHPSVPIHHLAHPRRTVSTSRAIRISMHALHRSVGGPEHPGPRVDAVRKSLPTCSMPPTSSFIKDVVRAAMPRSSRMLRPPRFSFLAARRKDQSNILATRFVALSSLRMNVSSWFGHGRPLVAGCARGGTVGAPLPERSGAAGQIEIR